jgi:hypothetical protein
MNAGNLFGKRAFDNNQYHAENYKEILGYRSMCLGPRCTALCLSPIFSCGDSSSGDGDNT